jgi:tripartite-type tricarboxylate transporter receptor subunit TctC
MPIRTPARILAFAACAFSVSAFGQATYPTKPIRLIVPFAAGGSGDILGRLFAQRLTQQYGQQVLVENRLGSGGHVGAEAAAKATPDGYTLVFGTIGIHASYSIYPKLGYDPARDLQAVALYADVPCVIIVHPSIPAKNVREFIALAKKNPGKLNFGSAGSGTSTNLAGELFKLVAGVDIAHIPYKGSAPAMQDLMGGQIDVMFENLPAAIPQIQGGRVRALALTTKVRSPSLPDLVTAAETGLPDYEASAWFTIAAPAKVPADIIRRLNAEMNAFLKAPEMKPRWIEMGVTPLGGTPEEAEKFFAVEREKWNRVIKTAGIRAG